MFADYLQMKNLKNILEYAFGFQDQYVYWCYSDVRYPMGWNTYFYVCC